MAFDLKSIYCYERCLVIVCQGHALNCSHVWKIFGIHPRQASGQLENNHQGIVQRTRTPNSYTLRKNFKKLGLTRSLWRSLDTAPESFINPTNTKNSPNNTDNIFNTTDPILALHFPYFIVIYPKTASLFLERREYMIRSISQRDRSCAPTNPQVPTFT